MSITKEAVKNKMMDRNVVVLNVSQENAYARLHIKGSGNIPLGQDTDDFVHAVEMRYGRDKFIITYCTDVTCNACLNAAKVLQKNGFKADDYPGGVQEWAESGFPTTNKIEAG